MLRADPRLATPVAGPRHPPKRLGGNPDLSLWYEIQSIPTLLYFVKGTLSYVAPVHLSSS